MRKRTWFLLLVACALLGGGGGLYYRWQYPYGWSHSCESCLWTVLVQYAEEHDGAFPAGEATPEASLSLLYPKYANAHLLQGKTVPLEVVQAILERGERLGPDTCGWHYVEGLTLKDDPRLALVWNKAGLGHNGQRTSDSGREVIRIGYSEYIPGPRWPAFLQEQQELLAARQEAGKRAP